MAFDRIGVRMMLISTIIFLVSSVLTSRARAAPSIEISYAYLFDEICAQNDKYKIEPAWVAEVKNRLPQIQAAWAKPGPGPVLLKTTEEVVGKNFDQKQIHIALTICSYPSMGDPLLVNMRYSLKSFIDKPLPPDVTIDTIYHEILHSYIGGEAGPYLGSIPGKIPPNSKLLLKYKGEDDTVRGHLHLLALEKAVYLKLGRTDTLERVIRNGKSLPNESYARTWEIVNEGDNYISFVNELRQKVN
jgi:hypothetical protein